MPTQPAAAAGFKALRRFGEPGNSEAVCPSSPMPSSHDIERAGNARERLPGGYRAEIRRGRGVLQSGEARRRGPVLEQHLAHHFLVAARVARLDPALIGERDAHPAPIDRLRAQLLEQLDRRAAARHDQTRDSPRGDAAAEILGNVARKRARQFIHVGIAFGFDAGVHAQSVALAPCGINTVP